MSGESLLDYLELVPYNIYFIYLFMIIVKNISQTSLNHFLDTKTNMSFLSFHTNLLISANFTKAIICIQSHNAYINLIAIILLSKRLSMSKKKKVLQVLKYRYYNYVCRNLQITSTMYVVHYITLIYNKSHNTRGS